MITKYLTLIFIASLSMSLIAPAEIKNVELESIDGKKITADLLEKGPDRVRLRTARKVYTLPFTKFSKESIEIIKNADIPTICDFKLSADFVKKSQEIRRTFREIYTDPESIVTYSYRLDKVSGKVTVRNLDRKEASPPAKLYVALLTRDKNDKKVALRKVIDVEPIMSGNESKFNIPEIETWHSPRGGDIIKSKDLSKGRYSGYITAVVIDGHIMEVKTVPSSYEKNLEAVRELLEIPQAELQKETKYKHLYLKQKKFTPVPLKNTN